MGARRKRSAITALQLLTEQVHTIWGAGQNQVATVLSMDMAGAFDNISHARLLYNLRKCGIPAQFMNWVSSFLKDRTTNLKIGNYLFEQLNVNTSIPQDSKISPILFLYFNVDLLDAAA